MASQAYHLHPTPPLAHSPLLVPTPIHQVSHPHHSTFSRFLIHRLIFPKPNPENDIPVPTPLSAPYWVQRLIHHQARSHLTIFRPIHPPACRSLLIFTLTMKVTRDGKVKLRVSPSWTFSSNGTIQQVTVNQVHK